MSWQDRVQDAVIETAAGDRFVFEYQDLSNTRDERATVFGFANRNGDYVQRRSSGSNVFPIVLFFSGDDYDEVADTFELATRDPRPLIFTHPIRKTSYNVQLLSLQRNDALSTQANEAAFSLTLHETIDLTAPLSEEDAPLYVDNTRSELELINASVYETDLELKLPSEITAIKTEMAKAIESASVLLDAYDIAADALAELEAIKLTAESLLTTFETNIAQLASVTQGLVNYPARVLQTTADKLQYYTDLLLDYTAEVTDPNNAMLLLSAGLTGYCQSTMQGDESYYVTKSAVFATIDQIQDYMDSYTTIIDGLEVTVSGFEQSGDVLKLLADITSTTAENLNGIAFAAKQERSIVLSKKEDAFVLTYRLLGADNMDELDDEVINFLKINKVLDSKVFELPQGETFKYYV